MVGCGSIGQGLLPLLFHTFSILPTQLSVISADDNGWHVADSLGVGYFVSPLTQSNYHAILARHLHAGDMLINLSVDVSSVALIVWCKSNNILYLDTCIEPWKGGYLEKKSSRLETTNAWLRQLALSQHEPGAPTAVIAHGMNPGLISHFLKAALLSLAHSKDIAVAHNPSWGALASLLGVKAVHIVERDTQGDNQPLKQGEFVNTWSAKGFYSEAWLQQAEVFAGSHENLLPTGAKPSINNYTLSLTATSGASLFCTSWLPTLGEQQGILMTHHEVISIGALLSTQTYRPTVCYSYTPCPKAQESLMNLQRGHPATHFRVLKNNALQGFDEIGVLLMHETGALWHGSTLDCSEARGLAPYNNATSLQVVAGIIGALAWMLDNPRAGVVEAESMGSEQILAAARPYLGKCTTVETDWRAGNSLTLNEFLVIKSGHKLLPSKNDRLYSRTINTEKA